MVLMKKNEDATAGRGSIGKYGEYIWLNIWCMLDWVLSQNCRNTLLLQTTDQLVSSAKNEMLLYLFKPGIKHRVDGPISDCKSTGLLPRAIA